MNRTTTNTVASLATSLLATSAMAAPPSWQDIPLGTTGVVGDITTSDGVVGQLACFEWSGGTTFCGGSARIDPMIPGCNDGHRITLNNITVALDYASSIGSVVDPIYDFGEYGGNINLEINGDFRNFDNMLDIDGTTIGGCVVEVLAGGTGGDCGSVRFNGVVDKLRVGGQEFWWDGRGDCDIAFEGLPFGATYPAVTNLVIDGVGTTIRELIPPAGSPYSGFARVGNSGMACGIGQELETNNCRASFDFASGPGPVIDLSLEFGEYGGFINVAINGDLAVVANFADLHGASLGGTTIHIAPMTGLGNDCGLMYVTGTVWELEVGGQECWIDCLKYEIDPDHAGGGGPMECEDAILDHADLPPTGPWATGDSVTTNGVDVHFTPFQSSFGLLFGHAEVSTANLACGDDLELATYNVAANYDFAGSIGTAVNVRVQVSDQAGEINLGVNGMSLRADDYRDLDGTTLGGVIVRVEAGGLDGDCTRLYLEGPVDGLTLGGQQHFIDCMWAEEILPPTAPGDLNGDGCVDAADMGFLLGAWATPAGDLNGDGTTDAADMGVLLGNWGC